MKLPARSHSFYGMKILTVYIIESKITVLRNGVIKEKVVRNMKTDNGTREKLLRSAKEEFMDKGFQNASLRKICSKAGVTTGAVYCFFGDKEGLLTGLVDNVYQSVMQTIGNHIKEMSSEGFAAHMHEVGDHDSFVEELVHALYQDYDAVVLLLSKSTGSKFENVIDDLISQVELRLGDLAEKYAESVQGKRVNYYMVHWLSHLSIMSFVHALTHFEDEREALKFMKPAMEHLIAGWRNFMLEDVERLCYDDSGRIQKYDN